MYSTIPAMFLDVCSRFSGERSKPVYGRKENGTWVTISHDVLREEVEAFAAGLLTDVVVPGERVGILSENRIEWAVADFALAALGCPDVPVFPSLTSEQLAFVYADCEASCIIVSNTLQLSKIQAIRDRLPLLRHVIVFNEIADLPPGCLRYADVLASGRQRGSASQRRQQFEAMAERIRTDDLLTIIYTSGTTGNPKGVMLTHGNITSNIAGALEAIPMNDSDVLLSYLPMCHAYERMAGYYLAFAVGATTYMAESIETVAENLRETRPTVMTSVPRLFERIRLRILGTIDRDAPHKRRIARWALSVGSRWEGGERGPLLAAQRVLAEKLVFSKIRQRLAPQLRFFVSGGAALHVEVGHFFSMLGIHILEGYGLTETSPVLAVNRVGAEELGTVGPPLPNVELRLADDGEILARGPNIMKGYWRDEAATAAVIDTNGWFHTGDIGTFTADGKLRITDRKKNILISSGGKNILPGPIEALVVTSPFIEQVLLIGDGREFCTALIVPDRTYVESWFAEKRKTFGSWESALNDEELRAALRDDLFRRQRDLAKHERIRRFALLSEPFTVENGLLTPTLKIKRREAERRYASVIDGLYREATTDI